MENTISLYERGTGYNRRGEYYGVQYLRTSDGDLFRIGDNNLDFYTNIDMDIYGIYSLYLYREDFGDLEDNKIDNFYPNFTIGNRTIICGNVT